MYILQNFFHITTRNEWTRLVLNFGDGSGSGSDSSDPAPKASAPDQLGMSLHEETCLNPLTSNAYSVSFLNVCDADQLQILLNKDITPETAYYVYFICITSDFRFKPHIHVRQ